MPTYEYACKKCGKNFDAYQSMRDEPYHFCPKELCREAKWGKGKVKRLLGVGAGLAKTIGADDEIPFPS